jgi:hypothetical protein
MSLKEGESGRRKAAAAIAADPWAQSVFPAGDVMRTPMFSAPVSGYILLLAASMAMAQNASNIEVVVSAKDETGRIMSLESAWNQAEVQHDARAMAMLLADGFQYTDADGSFLNRSAWLETIRKGVYQYDQLGNTAMAVSIYGNVAIVTGGYREKLKAKNSVVRTGRFTDTWILQNGQWRCVASQATLVSH